MTRGPGRGQRWALAALCVALGLGWGAPTAAQEPYKLLIWINGDKGYNGLQKVGDAFTKQSGVKVVVEHPEDTPAKFQSAAGAGKGPDIFCWPHDRVGEMAKSGLIVPVRPSKAVREAIEPTAWSAFEYQGKTWGYPLAIEAIGLIYNKALVKHPPQTFDEVVQLDRELAKQGKKAIIWDIGTSFFSWPLMAGGGGYVFGRNPKGDLDARLVGVNTPGAVQGGEVLERLVQGGQLPRGTKYSQAEGAFNSGDVAMFISGPWAWDNAKRSKIDFGVAPLPGVVAGMGPSKPFVGVLGCMVTAPSKVKDIAREFIEHHMLKLDALKTINADVPLGVPANKAFYAELASNPLIRATMDNARQGVPLPNIPEAGRFYAALDAALEAITNGRQSAKAALDAAQARMLTP